MNEKFRHYSGMVVKRFHEKSEMQLNIVCRFYAQCSEYSLSNLSEQCLNIIVLATCFSDSIQRNIQTMFREVTRTIIFRFYFWILSELSELCLDCSILSHFSAAQPLFRNKNLNIIVLVTSLNIVWIFLWILSEKLVWTTFWILSELSELCLDCSILSHFSAPQPLFRYKNLNKKTLNKADLFWTDMIQLLQFQVISTHSAIIQKVFRQVFSKIQLNSDEIQTILFMRDVPTLL